MKKKYIKDIADLYSKNVLSESVKTGELKTNVNEAPGLHPKNSGPDGKEGLVKAIDAKDGDNELTDGFSQEKEKKKKKLEETEKLYEMDINNCTMSNNNNIFDKLYATIMEAEDLDDESLGFDGGNGDEESELDELGIEDEGGGEVTVTLTTDEVDLLKSIVGKLDGDEDLEDLEDLDGEDGFDFGGGEDPLMEDGESKDLPDAVAKMTSPSNKKVAGKASNTPGAGKATSSAPKGGDGKPNTLADGVPRMTKKTAKADANLKHIGD